MRQIVKIAVVLLIIQIQWACVPTKNLTYLQTGEENTEVAAPADQQSYRVQVNDILNIRVRSYNEQTNFLFNTVAGENVGGGAGTGDMQAYLTGYSVANDGNIDMPVLGKVNVLHKNLSEIKALIEERLSKYFRDEAVFVLVQLAGVRFSIIGEINSPGKFVIYQNQVNIFEAIASAGDISMVGNRKEVQIIRRVDNKMEIIELNLLDDDVLSSPYYFIQPNDIINIKPLPAKSLGVGTTGFSTIGAVLGVISSTILILVTINNIN